MAVNHQELLVHEIYPSALLHEFSCSGGVSERILARKGAFDAPDRDLAGGVR
jgi:hypothetical protein